MIEPDKRKAIYLLYLEGMSIREIARRLSSSRHTVRTIIAQKGSPPEVTRTDKKKVEPQLLQELHHDCDGWVKRVHEKLQEERGINLGYSTLTRLLREHELGKRNQPRSHHVEDTPGEEMQHDTSTYRIIIGDQKVLVVASLLYLRYCKMRYLKFYRSFNRFGMKCFFHEALSFFEHTARHCIIDNTNLARLRGSGKTAIITPEMKAFSAGYGFEFICHEINHANRKAGNERSFYTVETNFFPGRQFNSMEDLNQQAKEWATQRMAQRAVSKSGLLPAKAFEFERSYLIKLPPYVEPPYLVLERITDQYGYISFEGNYYWMPNLSTGKVRVLQYSDEIKIYHNRQLLAQYSLPPRGVKNQRFNPPGQPAPYQPRHRKKPMDMEEKKLRAIGAEVDAYLTFALEQEQTVKQKYRFIRQLYALSKKLAQPLFIKTLQRALTYRNYNIETIEGMAIRQLKEGSYIMPPIIIDDNFKDRDSYLQGCVTDEVDFSVYDQLLDKEN